MDVWIHDYDTNIIPKIILRVRIIGNEIDRNSMVIGREIGNGMFCLNLA